jgi:hypothetical protein
LEDVEKDYGSLGHREFSPKHYAGSTIRSTRGRSSLTAASVSRACHSRTALRVHAAARRRPAKFRAIAEALPDTLAVHCKLGLGRTCTLIALYMMKDHGFTAARPWAGCASSAWVISAQQHFLCARHAQHHHWYDTRTITLNCTVISLFMIFDIHFLIRPPSPLQAQRPDGDQQRIHPLFMLGGGGDGGRSKNINVAMI